jgi:DNA-binding LacI/PurR family transcriptional regulator
MNRLSVNGAARTNLGAEGLAIAAWDDLVLCRLVNPPITALTHDVAAYGAPAARVLLECASGGDPGNRVEPAAVLSVRESGRRERWPAGRARWFRGSGTLDT